MKQLLLIRHAKSSWADTTLSDLDRPLKKRGKREASQLGKLLKKKTIFPQLIVSSPAKRTKKTAFKIARELDYKKQDIQISNLIYSDEIPDLLNFIHSIPNSQNRVFIVGHSPSIMELANHLVGKKFNKFKTSGHILIEFKIKSWKDVTKKCGKTITQFRVE